MTSRGMFRPTGPTATVWIITRTLVYAAVIWYLALCLGSRLIVWLESSLGFEQFHFPNQWIVATILFISFSVFNLSAAFTMATIGRGTPLPVDCAPTLVVSGVYRYVRNPMAIGGLGQGLSVGVGMGSIAVILYVFVGMMIWNYFVRPVEEKDLALRFGEPYRDYCEQVKCWIPTTSFRGDSVQ